MENMSNFEVLNSLGLQHPTPPEMSEGWSAYIDDLVAAQDMLLAAANSSSFGPPAAAELSSTVSNAASCIPARSRAASNGRVESLTARREHKRARDCRSLADDPLEDTASSTLSSPKEINGAAGSFAHLEELQEMRETAGLRPTAPSGSYEWSELRRRGLCLVPMSMLIDYLK